MIETFRRCNKGDLIRLFGLASGEAAPEDLLAPAKPELDPDWGKPKPVTDESAHWQYDRHGNRTWPKRRSAFDYASGGQWSSDTNDWRTS